MSELEKNNDNQETKKSIIFTKETLGVVLVLFATLCLICLVTGSTIFAAPGKWVSSFLYGTFGYFSFVVTIWLLVRGVTLVADKKLSSNKKAKTTITIAFVLLALIVQIATTWGFAGNYGAYLSRTYLMGEGGISSSAGGGVIVGLIAYPISSLLTEIGACVVLGILLVVDVYVLIVSYVKDSGVDQSQSKFNSSYVGSQPKSVDPVGVQISGVRDYPVDGVNIPCEKPVQKLFVNNPNDFQLKTNREMKKDESPAIKLGFTNGNLNVASSSTTTYTKSYNEDMQKKLEFIKTPSVIDVDKVLSTDYSTSPSSIMRENSQQSGTTVSDYVPERKIEQQPVESDIPMISHDNVIGDTAEQHADSFANRYADIEDVLDVPNTAVQPEPEEIYRPVEQVEEPVAEIPFIDESEEEQEDFSTPSYSNGPEIEEVEEETPQAPPESNVMGRRPRGIFFGEQPQEQPKEQTNVQSNETPSYTSRVQADGNLGSRGRVVGFGATPQPQEQPKEEPKKLEKVVPPINRTYHRPPLDLLTTYEQKADQEGEDHEGNKAIIKKTLEEFGINAEPQGHVQGPSITRYEILMPAGVSVKKVLGYDDDLKMRLASKYGIRIEAPIPGKNLVGIEVANKHKITVGLKQVIEGMASKKIKPSALEFAIGKDVVGNAISDDLAKGPHYLVAGATGSGKSVCLNVMIVSLIMRYSPEDLRLILIDPKRVGFRCYEHLPHLMIDEIITEPKKALAVLQWAYNEMERRYLAFETSPGVVSDIEAYNEQVASATVPKMPRIVIIVDELADLMETCKKDMELKIRALAQKSRAAGIHLVLATQRPSVDIITGTIKANLPSRIALKVMNFADSNTILSEGGAEKLLGNGDMLYKNSGMADHERYQGAWISNAEIYNVVRYIIEKNQAYFDEDLKDYLDKETNPRPEENNMEGGNANSDPNEMDPFFLKALWLGVTAGSISISQLQRRFQIGWSRAGGLIDKMETMCFVSGNEGSKARKVLLTRDDFEARFGPMSDNY